MTGCSSWRQPARIREVTLDLGNFFCSSFDLLLQLSFNRVPRPASAPESPNTSRASTPIQSEADEDDEDEVDSEEEREELGRRGDAISAPNFVEEKVAVAAA